jgi:hypothetical protein
MVLGLEGVLMSQRAGLAGWWQRLTSLAGWRSLGSQTDAALTTLTANWPLTLLIAVCFVSAGLTAFAVYLIAGRE